jgi:hemerythrin-like domain-containing protein
MVEHDLIRRVMTTLERQSARIEEEGDLDPVVLAEVLDFVTVYADSVHHGKEEEILFRQLHEKPLSADHRQTMEELAREHVEMRHLVDEIEDARQRYERGGKEELDTVRRAVDRLVEMYPAHMENEDQTFFPAAMKYLDDSDQENVLEEMRSHDRAMIHEKYGAVADHLDARTEGWELPE